MTCGEQTEYIETAAGGHCGWRRRSVTVGFSGNTYILICVGVKCIIQSHLFYCSSNEIVIKLCRNVECISQ